MPPLAEHRQVEGGRPRYRSAENSSASHPGGLIPSRSHSQLEDRVACRALHDSSATSADPVEPPQPHQEALRSNPPEPFHARRAVLTEARHVFYDALPISVS